MDSAGASRGPGRVGATWFAHSFRWLGAANSGESMRDHAPESPAKSRPESHLTDRMVLFSACLGMLLLFALYSVYIGSVILHGIEERATWSRIQFAEVLFRKNGVEDYVVGSAVILSSQRRMPHAGLEVEDVLKKGAQQVPAGEWFRLAATPVRDSVGILRSQSGALGPFILYDQAERLGQIDHLVLRAMHVNIRSLLIDLDGQVLFSVPAPGRSYEQDRVLPQSAQEQPVYRYLGIEDPRHTQEPEARHCVWRASAGTAFGTRTVFCLRIQYDDEGMPIAIVGASLPLASLIAFSGPPDRLPDRYAYFDFEGRLLADGLREGRGSEETVLRASGFSDWDLSADELHVNLVEPANAKGWRMVAVFPLAGILVAQMKPLMLASLFFSLGVIVVLGSAWRLHARVVLPARLQATRIRESESFYRTAMRTAPVGLAILRRSDAELLDANKIGSELLTDRRIRRDILQREVELADVEGDIEVSWRTPESQVRALSVAVDDMEFRGQDAVFCAVTDVSAYKALVLDLARAKREADAANAAKSAFVATMSHEIRTPLYGMLGTLELVLSGKLEQRVRDRLGAVEHSSNTLLQIVNEVLDFSKISAGELVLHEERFDPAAVVEEVVRGFATLAAGKDIALICCVQPGLPWLHGDPLRVRQILSNFANNAIKFTERGRVLISAGGHTDGERFMLELRVVDTGPGMSREEQTRLFTPFAQGEGGRARGGTGLGLSICKQLAKLMHGRIDVASERFLGSSFMFSVSLPHEDRPRECSLTGLPPVWIGVADPDLAACLAAVVEYQGGAIAPAGTGAQLAVIDTIPGAAGPARVCVLPDGPLRPERKGGNWFVSAYSQESIRDALAQAGGLATPETASSESIGELLPQLGLRILVAEDHPINRMLLRDQLQALGCSAVLAGDGQEAQAHWQASEFDLLLTDVNMPVCDGFMLARNLRAQGVRKPIIGVTANLGDERRCVDAGMDVCIVKPVSVAVLGNALRPYAATAVPDTLPSGLPEPLPADVEQVVVELLRSDIERLGALVTEHRHRDAGVATHRLKGALASLGAVAAAASCVRLEGLLTEGDRGRIGAGFEVLEGEVRQFLEEGS